MSDWKRINAARITKGFYGSTAEDGFNGAFEFALNGLPVRVIASDGEGWMHVSVSIAGKPNIIPSYYIMCQVKEIFWGLDEWVVEFHPPASEKINNHEGCLHLWKSTGLPQPTPPSILVGIKDL